MFGLIKGGMKLIHKPLVGSIEDKIKIEYLEAKAAEQEQANSELAVTVDSILTEVLPSLMMNM